MERWWPPRISKGSMPAARRIRSWSSTCRPRSPSFCSSATLRTKACCSPLLRRLRVSSERGGRGGGVVLGGISLPGIAAAAPALSRGAALWCRDAGFEKGSLVGADQFLCFGVLQTGGAFGVFRSGVAGRRRSRSSRRRYGGGGRRAGGGHIGQG